jgi:hypothetical protein
MKKNLLNEIDQMKYLFGYQKGRVISEQKNKVVEGDYEEDTMFADTDMEDEMDIEDEMDMDINFGDTDVAPAPTREKERTKERETEKEKPYDPARRERDPSRLPYTDPDTHPQGEYEDDEMEYEFEFDDEDVNEPFVDDVDSEYENSDLADLVNKYLSNRM